MLELGTAHPLQRLKAVRELVDAGVRAGVLMAPMVPGITSDPEQLERTVKTIADVFTLEREDNKRRRRVSEEEEAALLAVASPHLRSMIIAALDTGMRRGEMLALRFGDVDWKRRLIVLRGVTTKSRRTRVVPIGTCRLLAVLEWLRLDSAGRHKNDDVPVFSNEVGEPLKTFKKAWQVAILKAHGFDPRWRKGPRTSRASASSISVRSTFTGTT